MHRHCILKNPGTSSVTKHFVYLRLQKTFTVCFEKLKIESNLSVHYSDLLCGGEASQNWSRCVGETCFPQSGTNSLESGASGQNQGNAYICVLFTHLRLYDDHKHCRSPLPDDQMTQQKQHLSLAKNVEKSLNFQLTF